MCLTCGRGAARARRRTGGAGGGRCAAAARGEGRIGRDQRRAGDRQDRRWCAGSPATSPAARVLFGTCDDLSIPRPLGPFRDLAGSVSAELEDALAGGAAPHDIQDLLIAELERPPRPVVLVLEDVHWADDATLDSITRARPPDRRRCPRSWWSRYRSGEAPPGHPLHAALGAVPARRRSCCSSSRRCRASAVAALAGEDGDAVYAATGGNPFYVTELLASRDAAELPPSVANAVLARVSRLDDAARRLVELVSVGAEPGARRRCSTR